MSTMALPDTDCAGASTAAAESVVAADADWPATALREAVWVARWAASAAASASAAARRAASSSATRSATGAVSSARVVFGGVASTRSEEHTSELQSRGQLVCRLLLAKATKR